MVPLPPIDLPGIVPPIRIDPPGGDVVASEHSLTLAPGGSATYTLVLSEAPTADVTVTVEAQSLTLFPLADAGPGVGVTVAPTTLTFTAANWSTPQTVTVTAPAAATNQVAFLVHRVSSADANFDGDFVPPVLAKVERPRPGVTVSDPFLSVTPGGPAVSYTLVLDTAPTADVTITVAQQPPFTLPPLPIELSNLVSAIGLPTIQPPPAPTLTITPTTLTFTPANWNVAQTVTVAALADALTHLGPTGSAGPQDRQRRRRLRRPVRPACGGPRGR